MLAVRWQRNCISFLLSEPKEKGGRCESWDREEWVLIGRRHGNPSLWSRSWPAELCYRSLAFLSLSLSLVHHRLTFYDCSTRLASIPNPLQSRTHTQPRYYSSNSSSRSVVYRVETLRDPPLQSGGCDVLYTSTLGVVRHFRPARPHINSLSSLRIGPYCLISGWWSTALHWLFFWSDQQAAGGNSRLVVVDPSLFLCWRSSAV